ncbi:hypothetical protein M758_2G096600 [Ceratodon purpureus]|nr:hypothetical protein M758_2G096600 [Ceratodon purpureus]
MNLSQSTLNEMLSQLEPLVLLLLQSRLGNKCTRLVALYFYSSRSFRDTCRTDKRWSYWLLNLTMSGCAIRSDFTLR